MNKKALIIIFSLIFALGTNLVFSQEIEDKAQSAAILYNEAIDLYGQDEIEKSIEYFTKALELKPDFYEAHYNLAQILMSINKNDEAIKSLEEIAKIKPDDAENLYNLGKIYFKKGYLSKSFESLKKIDVNAQQYDDAKLLISKIEKRQEELNLEEKIKKHENIIDIQGISKGVELAEFSAPSGAAIDSKGNIYVASFSQNQIHKLATDGQQTIYSKSNLIQGPIGIAIDKNDNVYVANYNANNIIKITPKNVASVFAQINKPYCLTYDLANNRLYATEQGSNKLIKFDL